MAKPETPKKKGFEFADILVRMLAILQHTRLICILSTFGVMGGLVAYCYTTPYYYSRSLLNWSIYGLPFHDDTEVRAGGGSYYNVWRDLKLQLEADQLIKDTAVKLGVAKKSDDMDVVKSAIRMPRILYRDHQNLLVELWAADPEIVREYPRALVEAYQEGQARQRREHREKALGRYLSEVDQLKQKIDGELKRRLDMERDSQMDTLTIKQERLLKLPVEIERCKAQIKRMDDIAQNFKQNGEKLDNVAKLSLLSAFDREWAEEEKIKPGEIIKRAPSERSPFTQTAEPPPKVDVVVVGPQMAEGSEPWRKLEKEQRLLKEEIRQTSQKFLPGHENMVKLTDRLRDVEHQLESELEVAMQRFQLEHTRVKAHLPDLEAQLPEYYDTMKNYEQKRLDYSLLAKSQEDWASAHVDLTKRIAAIQFGDAKQQVEVGFNGYEELDDRTPVTPSPSKAMSIALALMLGLGLGVPILIEYLNSTVSRLPQLENRLGLRGLGIIPAASAKTLEDIFRAPALGAKVPNYLLECFRVVRSNIILYAEDGGRSKIIAITSARPSEGKSTMAANLAWAFFSMGERTLLVDTDLRRGRIHSILNLDNKKGLSTFFEGRATADQIVQTTSNPKLDVVTRGEFVTGATEFLCREVFDDLIAEWAKHYDRIVLDGPPVLGLSETTAIQRVADGVVMVVRAENTKVLDVESAVDQMRRGGAKFFGFVLNRLDLRKPTNHYSYYYYTPDYYTSDVPDEEEEPSRVATA